MSCQKLNTAATLQSSEPPECQEFPAAMPITLPSLTTADLLELAEDWALPEEAPTRVMRAWEVQELLRWAEGVG